MRINTTLFNKRSIGQMINELPFFKQVLSDSKKVFNFFADPQNGIGHMINNLKLIKRLKYGRVVKNTTKEFNRFEIELRQSKSGKFTAITKSGKVATPDSVFQSDDGIVHVIIPHHTIGNLLPLKF